MDCFCFFFTGGCNGTAELWSFKNKLALGVESLICSCSFSSSLFLEVGFELNS